MIATVADAVKTSGIRKAVVGLRVKYTRITPSPETELAFAWQHEVNHFFAEHENRIGIGRQGRIFPDVSQNMQHLFLARFHHELRQFHDILPQEHRVDIHIGHRRFVKTHETDCQRTIYSRRLGDPTTATAGTYEFTAAVKNRCTFKRLACQGVSHNEKAPPSRNIRCKTHHHQYCSK